MPSYACEECGHAVVDHLFGQCHIPGCTCGPACKVCGHPKASHFFGVCREPGCRCAWGKLWELY